MSGAALSDIGRVDTHSPFELHYQAASRAIADAGLTKADIDGFGSSGMGLLAPVEIAEYLGLRPTWADGTGVGGSTWEFMVEHATAAILAGHAETVVLVYGSTARADLKARRRSANLSFGARGPVQFDVPFGHTLISKYAMAARRHMHEYGTTIEQLAEIAVSTRYNASLNPEAYYRDLITIDDVQNERMMADPLTKRHCCIRSDGGGAVVLTTEERARDCAKAPVWILGTGETTSHTTMSEWEDFTESPAVRSGAARVRARGRDARTTSTAASSTTRSRRWCWRRSRRWDSASAAKAGRSWRTASCASAVRSRPTPTAAGSRTATPACAACSCSSKARASCAARRTAVRSRTPKLCCVNGTGGWFSSASTVILGAG